MHSETKNLQTDSVSEFYTGYDEGNRLFVTPQGRLERARIQSLLARHMPPPPARVLDIGGAEGVHSTWMVGQGWDVELFDLTQKHVDAANKLGLFKAEQADARDIDRPDGYADAVALLGPLYHLCDKSDRLATLRESWRLLKPGAPIVAVAINKYKFLYEPTQSRTDEGILQFIEDIEVHGGSVKFGEGFGHNAFYHLPGELEEEMMQAGFRDIQVVAVEAFGWPRGWEPTPVTLDAIERLESSDTALATTWHLAAIAKK